MLADLLAHPDVVEECHIGSPVGLMALHGGGLERCTDVVAAEVADRLDASRYAVLFPDDHDHIGHPPSTTYDPAQSPALARFLDHVEVVVSLHGYGRAHLRRSVLVGGSNRALAEHLARSCRRRLPGYEFVTDLDRIPPGLRGRHRRNPVNRPAQGGVQLELPPTLRWHRAEWGWSDSNGIGRAPQLDRLIDGLVDGLAAWSAQ